MFPLAKTRFASAARRSIDLALEFATLGEYRLPAEPEEAGPAAQWRGPSGLADPRARARAEARAESVGVPTRPRADRLRPATPAARRLQPGVAPRRIASHTAVRALALSAHDQRPSRGGRHRAGAAKPRPQPCLVGDAGGHWPMDD
jgi:hypothetical protein